MQLNLIIENKSHGDLNQLSNSYIQSYPHLMSQMIAKYTNEISESLNVNNTQNQAKKVIASDYESQKFKPNTVANRTMNDYTNPNFLTNNIINTVNKTVYKARVAALGSRGNKTFSNSNQKDTTILDKKVIFPSPFYRA